MQQQAVRSTTKASVPERPARQNQFAGSPFPSLPRTVWASRCRHKRSSLSSTASYSRRHHPHPPSAVVCTASVVFPSGNCGDEELRSQSFSIVRPDSPRGAEQRCRRQSGHALQETLRALRAFVLTATTALHGGHSLVRLPSLTRLAVVTSRRTTPATADLRRLRLRLCFETACRRTCFPLSLHTTAPPQQRRLWVTPGPTTLASHGCSLCRDPIPTTPLARTRDDTTPGPLIPIPPPSTLQGTSASPWFTLERNI